MFHSHECEHFTYTYIYGKLYTFRSFWALISIQITSEAPNLIVTINLMLIIIILNFINWRHGWGVFYIWVNISNTFKTNYTFRRFWALNPTHIVSEAPNLIVTFNCLLLIIILNFINGWRGWGLCVLYTGVWAFQIQTVHIL